MRQFAGPFVLAMLPICAAVASPIDADTLVYVSFDGVQGAAAATGVNINEVVSGPTAQLITQGSGTPTALYGSPVASRMSAGSSDSSPWSNLSSLHVMTNGVPANPGGGTALSIASSSVFGGSFTLEFYFRTDGQIGTADQFHRPNLVFSGSIPEIQLTFDTTAKLQLVYPNSARSASTSQVTGDAHQYDDGEWHHVAIVYSRAAEDANNVLSLFVDHDSTAKITANGVVLDSSSSADIEIGRKRMSATSGIRFLNGWYDEFRLTQRALGAAEFLCEMPPASRMVREDTLVYVSFDGQIGADMRTGLNLNAVAAGPLAELVGTAGATAPVYSSDCLGPAIYNGRKGDLEANESSCSFVGTPTAGMAVRIAPTNFFAGSFTAEVFFKCREPISSSLSSAPCILFSGDVPDLQVTFNKADGKLYIAYSNPTWAGEPFGDAHQYDDGEWHHLAVVHDKLAKTLEVFLDWKSAWRKTSVEISPAQEYAMFVGSRSLGSRYFDGWLDAFRFSTSALAPREFLTFTPSLGLLLFFK